MYLDLLADSSFYDFLLQIDQDLADQTRRSGCRFCGAPLHSACCRRAGRSSLRIIGRRTHSSVPAKASACSWIRLIAYPTLSTSPNGK